MAVIVASNTNSFHLGDLPSPWQLLLITGKHKRTLGPSQRAASKWMSYSNHAYLFLIISCYVLVTEVSLSTAFFCAFLGGGHGTGQQQCET